MFVNEKLNKLYIVTVSRDTSHLYVPQDWLPVGIRSWMPVYIEWSRSSKAGLNFRAAYEFIKDTYCGYHTTTKPEGEVNGGDLASSGLKLNQYYQQKCTWILNSVTDRQLTIEVRSTQNRKNNYFPFYIFLSFLFFSLLCKFVGYKANFHSILVRANESSNTLSLKRKGKRDTHLFLDYSCILVSHTIETYEISSSNFSILAHLNRDPPIHGHGDSAADQRRLLIDATLCPFPSGEFRWIRASATPPEFRSAPLSQAMGANRIERPPPRRRQRAKQKGKRKRGPVRLRKRGWTSRTNGRQDWRLKRLLDDAGQRRRGNWSLKAPWLLPFSLDFLFLPVVFSGFPPPPAFAPWNKRENVAKRRNCCNEARNGSRPLVSFYQDRSFLLFPQLFLVEIVSVLFAYNYRSVMEVIW